MIKAEVVLASESPDGVRLYTVLLTYPRFIHGEVMTHRDRARNAASSRAIPWKKYVADSPPKAVLDLEIAQGLMVDDREFLVPNCMYKMIADDPVVPAVFGSEKRGMQTGAEVDDVVEARRAWLKARDAALFHANRLAQLGVHKSIVNRLVEPFMWMTTLMSATEWKNFFRLRDHPDAEVHFRMLAQATRKAIDEAPVQKLRYKEWHLPFIQPEEARSYDIENLKKMSAARCARLSYLTHDGKRDVEADVALTERLIQRADDVIHASPLEHVACAMEKEHRSGPFRGWKQFRKEFENENVAG